MEDEIQEFTCWASLLGCPLDVVPKENSIRHILRTKDFIFKKIISKCKPKQEVKNIRDNILIEKVAKFKNTLIPASSKKLLPIHYQRFEKVTKLQLKIHDKEKNIDQHMDQYLMLQNNLKNKNLLKLKLQNQIKETEIKLFFYKAKNTSLENHISVENETLQKIIDVIPIKVELQNSNKAKVRLALEDGFQSLDEFYVVFSNCAQADEISIAKSNLWEKLRDQLSSIPNISLWSVLLELIEQKVGTISSLNLAKNTNENKTIYKFGYNSSPLIYGISRAFANHIALNLDNDNKTMENVRLTAQYELNYVNFCKSVNSQINSFHSPNNESKQLIDEYVIEFLATYYNMGQLHFLSLEKEKRLLEIADRKNNLENHETLINQLKKIYFDIEKTALRFQGEIIQLTQIKEKILYTKDLTSYHIFNMRQTHAISSMGKTTLNSSMGSFCASESALCSTKIGCSMMETDIVPRTDTSSASTAVYSVPMYVNEISLFADISIERFGSNSIRTTCWDLDLRSSSYFLDNTVLEMHGLHLLSVNGISQHIENTCQWFSKIENLLKEKEFHLTNVNVDLDLLKHKLVQQNETLLELLDNINVVAINAKRIMQKSRVYYDFLINKPLKKFIPPIKLFDNRKFIEYEAEYAMYYKMAKGSK